MLNTNLGADKMYKTLLEVIFFFGIGMMMFYFYLIRRAIKCSREMEAINRHFWADMLEVCLIPCLIFPIVYSILFLKGVL